MWQGRQAISHEPLANSSELTANSFPLDWFENRLNKVRAEVDSLMKQFRLSEALKTIYSLIWDDFCSWYLEWIKPGFEQPIDAIVYNRTIGYFEELMQLLHPFMPFVTEEIYHLLKTQTDDLCVKQFAELNTVDEKILADGELLKQVITNIRDGRNKNQLKPKEPIKLFIETDSKESYSAIENIICKQVNADELSFESVSIKSLITSFGFN